MTNEEKGLYDRIDDLREQVHKFNMLQLPGQPLMMHMGTAYLVSDLWSMIQELKAEIEEFHSK